MKRIYVSKKLEFRSNTLFEELKTYLKLNTLTYLNEVQCYDIEGIDEIEFEKSINLVFSEPLLDDVYKEKYPLSKENISFATQLIKGQFDIRAESSKQCISLFSELKDLKISTSKLYILNADINQNELKKIKEYLINPTDTTEISITKPDTIENEEQYVGEIKNINNFINLNDSEIINLREEIKINLSLEDIKFCQDYFKTEGRNPTITELKILDAYWSDHCRHTTFLTHLENIEFEDKSESNYIYKEYKNYLEIKDKYSPNSPITLMDLATIMVKKLRGNKKLNDLDISDEINACTINIKAYINSRQEDWVLLFKNETHNHPTEIEPFGGAATCLGGAIRDPLSGRSYPYQSIRVSGCGNPLQPISLTIPNKLPQRKITKGAALGFSSYGNQIGIATGQVAEIYHPKYIAKRMEVGGVIAAAPKSFIFRGKPFVGDKVLLIGGKTGRDGCGGASGSSIEHNEKSLKKSNQEVQKGNPIEERKIMRLFRNIEITKRIKKCNDFGAGGVCVAVGEIAESIDIFLNAIPKKFQGLDGTELAISESQERMAVLIDNKDVNTFINLCIEENLEASVIAEVTNKNRVRFFWNETEIVNFSRDFLNTNGIVRKANVLIKNTNTNFFVPKIENEIFEKTLLKNLINLNVCSQKGLVEMFDSTVGGNTILMPYGGKYQLTPSDSMVAKLPIQNCNTTSIVSYGYNPYLSDDNPFLGAAYAVIDSITKNVSNGGVMENLRFSFQEYFEKLEDNPEKWGKPFQALLGANHVLDGLNLAAIGGKDSMSGTFKDLNVPPTLISFAFTTIETNQIISQEFKKINSNVYLLPHSRSINNLPNLLQLKNNYTLIKELNFKKYILTAKSVGEGGIATAVAKMAFGNKYGFKFNSKISLKDLFEPSFGSIIFEINDKELPLNLLQNAVLIGNTIEENQIIYNNEKIELKKLIEKWEEPLSSVYEFKPLNIDKNENEKINIENKIVNKIDNIKKKSIFRFAKPNILIPIFPGTNCEYESQWAFEKVGGKVKTIVLKNLTHKHLQESIEKLSKEIMGSQILFIPGGFSASDEPDGSGKYIASILRNKLIEEALNKLLHKNDGLILGICNGFQALVKSGLLPYGKICEPTKIKYTLTKNKIGRHISLVTNTKVVSKLSPWLGFCNINEIYSTIVSHGEGCFYGNKKDLEELKEKEQICTQYVDEGGNATLNYPENPNGSEYSIESICSLDGKIYGKMGHSERSNEKFPLNIYGNKYQPIFKGGVNYFY